MQTTALPPGVGTVGAVRRTVELRDGYSKAFEAPTGQARERERERDTHTTQKKQQSPPNPHPQQNRS